MSPRSVSPTSDYTPDIHWGRPWFARRAPLPWRLHRALRRLFGAWQLWMFTIGGILGASVVLSAPAHADVSVEAAAYASANSAVICDILALDPTVASVEDVVIAMMRDGLTPTQAGEVLPLAVYVNCPAFGYLVEGYIIKWAPEAGAAAGVKIAGGIGGALR